MREKEISITKLSTPPNRQRRQLLAGLAAALTFSRPLLAAAEIPAQSSNWLDTYSRERLAWLTETVIPQTDTPGAIAADVPRYVEHMVAVWMTTAERAVFVKGLADTEQLAQLRYARSFARCDIHQRESLLEQMEREAGSIDWYIPGNVNRAFDSSAPFITQLKELSVWGYFTSEVGATQTLTANFNGGEFDGDIPLSEAGHSWAAVFTTY